MARRSRVSRPSTALLTLASAGAGLICSGAGLYALHNSKNPQLPPFVSANFPRSILGVCFGQLSCTPIPRFLRPYVYRQYCNIVDCNSSTYDADDMVNFRSLSHFISRPISFPSKKINDNIDNNDSILSPCFGVIEAVGTAGPFASIRVKNVTHSVREILGADVMDPLTDTAINVDVDTKAEADNTCMWYIVLRLRAKDPHSFASPCNWATITDTDTTSAIRTIPGTLYCPPAEGKFPKNERIAIRGSWTHGLFSFTAVGAAARRTVIIHKDEEESEHDQDNQKPMRNEFKTGEEIGRFRIGSAIILVFEAPRHGFNIIVNEGEAVHAGQTLAVVDESLRAENEAQQALRKQQQQSKTQQKTSPSRQRFRRAW